MTESWSTIYLIDGLVLPGHTKKTSVSGVAAGWFKKVRMGTFFSFLQKKKIVLNMDNIFLPKKKLRGKKKSGLPTGLKKGHPLDRKQKFFLGWPHGKGVKATHCVWSVSFPSFQADHCINVLPLYSWWT